MNPFSKDYKPQIDTSDITRERKVVEARKASMEARRKSDDPAVRRQAEGTILGLSKRADQHVKETIGRWTKNSAARAKMKDGAS